jgi:hypothetical protein
MASDFLNNQGFDSIYNMTDGMLEWVGSGFDDVGCCSSDSECDDGLYCTGVETCVDLDCRAGTDPCPDPYEICNELHDNCTECPNDYDCDGVPDGFPDNCPETPNGPNLGTCVKEVGNIVIPIRVYRHTVKCTDNSTCEIIFEEGYCQMEQGDINENGVGDACECYADFNGDGIVSSPDLDVFEAEYYQTPGVRTATNPVPPAPGCYCADANNDGIVSTPDYDLFEAAYYQLCPYSNPCPNVP